MHLDIDVGNPEGVAKEDLANRISPQVWLRLRGYTTQVRVGGLRLCSCGFNRCSPKL